MALYKYHYIELDTKRSPRISLQNIVAGETGNRLIITVTNNGETIDMSEKSSGAFIYRVCLKIDSDLGTRRQDSATENSGITFIEANTGDHGKINILLSKDSFTAGKNRARLEIYSTRSEENDTLIVSAEWTFDVDGADEGDNVGVATPLLVLYEKLAESWARGGTGVRDGENTDNAMYFKTLAEQAVQGGIVDPTVAEWLETKSDHIDGVITDEVDDWLDDHPEATTTVQDASLTPAKLASKLKAAYDAVVPIKAMSLTWERGNINNSGANANSTRFVRTASQVSVTSTPIYIEFDGSYSANSMYSVFIYDSAGTFVSRINKTADATITPTAGQKIRILLSTGSPDTTTVIDVDDADDILQVTADDVRNLDTDKTLSIADRPADAKAVGEALLIGKAIPMAWERGTISSTGYDASSSATNRIRTRSRYKVTTSAINVTVPNGLSVSVAAYDAVADGTYLGAIAQNLTANTVVSVTSGTYIRVIAKRTDDSDLAPSVGKTVIVKYAESMDDAYAEFVTAEIDDYCSLSMFQTFAVIGDSFASGSIHKPIDGSYTGNYALSWGQILARKIGATCTNYSKGGLSTKTWLADATYGLATLLADTAKQLYIIALGINDNTQISAGTLTLGSLSDINEDYTQNPDTFYGDYARIIGNIKTKAPNAIIVCLSVARPNERGMDAHIKAIADECGVPYISLIDDPYFVSGYFYGSLYSAHPVAYGYAGMANAIQRLIQRFIVENPTYFENYDGSTE